MIFVCFRITKVKSNLRTLVIKVQRLNIKLNPAVNVSLCINWINFKRKDPLLYDLESIYCITKVFVLVQINKTNTIGSPCFKSTQRYYHKSNSRTYFIHIDWTLLNCIRIKQRHIIDSINIGSLSNKRKCDLLPIRLLWIHMWPSNIEETSKITHVTI